MVFSNPYYFILLTVLIPYIIWYVMRSKNSRATLKMPEASKYKALPKSLRQYLIHVPFLLRIILITLVVCILARPQSKHSWSDTDVEGIDIMLAVDVSTSMLAQDFKPNRVEALREIAQHFIEKRMNDNIGLTFFAGEAYTQCPLTTDHAALMNLKAKSKVIILLTDGVNNAGNISPVTAAEIAKKQKVRIYTIGIGTTGMAPYPLPTGGTVSLPVEIDEATMTKISKETGGQYFRAQRNAELDAIYNDIDKMERTKFNVRQYSKRGELFEPFALAALIVFLLELLMRMVVLRRLP